MEKLLALLGVAGECQAFLDGGDDGTCLKLAVSKLLGYSTIAGSAFLKAPQVVNILQSKSVEGLSPLAFYLEVPLYANQVIYNVLQDSPFSSYGEIALVGLQNVLLVLLLWAFSRPRPSAGEVLGVCAAFAAIGIVGMRLPPDLQWTLTASALPLLIVSKMLQIVECYRVGSTGSLSIITVFLQVVGSVVRIFTTFQEVANPLPVVATHATSMILALILMGQIVWYAYLKPKPKAD